MYFDAITDFIFVEDQLRKSDIIFIPGSVCPELAVWAARLYREGYAPYILPSGKYSITKGYFEPPEPDRGEPAGAARDEKNAARFAGATECDYLCSILKEEGVPESAILREREATFTWENAIYSRKRTDETGLTIRRAILCCKAFHARRSLMYYQQQFPETDFAVSPVIVDGVSRENWYTTRFGIDTVLGEVERCGRQFHEIIAETVEEIK